MRTNTHALTDLIVRAISFGMHMPTLKRNSWKLMIGITLSGSKWRKRRLKDNSLSLFYTLHSAEQYDKLKQIYLERLKVLHLACDETFAKYSQLNSTYDNNNYEANLVEANKIFAVTKEAAEERDYYEQYLVKNNTKSLILLLTLLWLILLLRKMKTTHWTPITSTLKMRNSPRRWRAWITCGIFMNGPLLSTVPM